MFRQIIDSNTLNTARDKSGGYAFLGNAGNDCTCLG